MCGIIHPIHCIVPPYMVDQLMARGSKVALTRAIDNKFRSHRFRSDRQFFSSAAPTVRRALLIRKAKARVRPILEIYDAQNKATLPGKLLKMAKAGTYKDPEANRAYGGGMHTWELYHEVYGRNSIDNEGLAIIQTIHYGTRYQNAFWNGRQMVYGDGDGVIFGHFTEDLDIIGHELTHGVTQYACNLDYENQSGAMNESFSDVFGILTKQRALKLTAKESNWLIGEQVLKGAEYALRSMKAPGTAYVDHPHLGTDPQPATMDDYMELPNTPEGDWGGVHLNSGIPNFAFYVAAFNRGGNAWETIGRAWYGALTDTARVQPSAGFTQVAAATLEHARTLFGEGSMEERAIDQGWREARVL